VNEVSVARKVYEHLLAPDRVITPPATTMDPETDVAPMVIAVKAEILEPCRIVR
jgi:hypothetical protein